MPSFKKAVGRPEKINQEIIKKICNYLRLGAYVETAAVVAGIDKTTFYEWKKKGAKKPNSIYGEFSNAVDRAVEECILRDLAIIDQAANGTKNAILLKDEEGNQLYGKDGEILHIKPIQPDWSAAAWRLERRHARTWSKTEKIETSGPDRGPIEITTESPEDKQKRIDAKLAVLKLALTE